MWASRREGTWPPFSTRPVTWPRWTWATISIDPAASTAVGQVTPLAAAWRAGAGTPQLCASGKPGGLLLDVLRAASVPVTFYSVAGGGHGDFAEPRVRQLVTDFLTSIAR